MFEKLSRKTSADRILVNEDFKIRRTHNRVLEINMKSIRGYMDMSVVYKRERAQVSHGKFFENRL